MQPKLDLSTEFIGIVSKLRLNPEDQALKHSLLRYLPQMKALAEVDPMAQYRLAQSYPKSSEEYQTRMIKAAKAGSTNAMLAACEVFLEARDYKQAAKYLLKLQQSGDTFMNVSAKELLKNYPKFSASQQHQCSAFFRNTRSVVRDEKRADVNCVLS